MKYNLNLNYEILGGELLNDFTKVGGIGGTLVIALPLISQFIIRDAIPLNTQVYIVLTFLLVATAIPAGIFYYRTKDLEKILEEQKDTINSLNEDIEELTKNREGLKDNLRNKDIENEQLKNIIRLHIINQSPEVLERIEVAATTPYIGGPTNGSESNKNNK